MLDKLRGFVHLKLEPLWLSRRWNNALRAHRDAQDTYDQATNTATGTLTDAQQTRIRQLVTDFPAIFNDPRTPHRERKRMARLLLTDVTVTKTADTITCHVRLPGGQHHTLTLPTLKPAWLLRKTPPHVVAAVDDLLGHHTHTEIADILNNRGLTSGEGRPFHKLTIARIARNYQLPSREQRLREAGLLTLTEMAAALNVSTGTVKTWRDAGLVNGHRFNDHGQMLYDPPGPNPPTRHQGHPALTKRRPAQTPQPIATNQRGAV